jgi:NAD(P)-dependent dehydrogenase (short-subunit alcohol dehydrogenase family)
METVLVIGSTGNIGASAVTAALRSKRKVLAIVRNQNSADKLVKHIGSSERITFVEADVLSDSGVQGVVDQIRAGKLPSFQHVYSCGQFPVVLISQTLPPLTFQSSWRRVHRNSPQGHHHYPAALQYEDL